ncbi:MAG: hypothetical protein ACRECG_12585 [Bradyrhizobium sp.]|jgi:hypothetical protein
MRLHSQPHDADELANRLRHADAATPELLADTIDGVCRRFPSLGQRGKTARVEHLIRSSAWTDAALALMELELPQWQIRRIAYDQGEWHCAVSRERELPDWLDQSVEARHPDLALAILCAFVDAQRVAKPSSRTSVPAVQRDAGTQYQPLCCENFA